VFASHSINSRFSCLHLPLDEVESKSIFNTENCWKIADGCVLIRGSRQFLSMLGGEREKAAENFNFN
jgi:hypothetical protein